MVLRSDCCVEEFPDYDQMLVEGVVRAHLSGGSQ